MFSQFAKRKWSVRTKNAAVALLFLCAYSTSAVIPFVPVATTSALDTGWSTPTATHTPNNWDVNTVANAQTSNNVYINENDGSEQGYSFSIPSIPAGAVINGIEVTAEAKSTDNNGCRLGVALSWNNGSNYTAYQYSNLGNSDSSEDFGGTADTWGRTWSVAEFSAANFVMKLQDNDPGNQCDDNATTSVDVVSVKVHYTIPVQPVANPSLSQACGLDIAIVIDNSTSIDSGEMTQMKTALTGFTTALAGTPTEYSVTRFATSASVLQAFTSNVTDVNAAINGVPVGGGFTNWEDGFVKAQSTLPNRTNPDLVLFATDGDPTTSNTVGGTDTGQPNAHLDPAIVAANSVKTGGARVLALGIGLGGNAGSVDRLKQISGPNADTGSVLTSDLITTNFSTLAQDLAMFAEQTCGGTITTQKLIDADGNPQTTDDQTPAQNWQFDINGGSNPAPTTTDAQGLTPAVKVDAGSGYSVNETTKPGYAVIAANCTGASNNGTWSGSSVTGMTVTANNVVRCTFVNKELKGSVQLIKVVTNNNGGTLGVNDFGLTVGGVSVSSGQTVNVPAGEPVAINEQGADGYSFVSITGAGCPAALGGTVTPADGQTITCTITNDDKPAKLIVKKVVINNNGGLKVVSDFKFQVNGGMQTAFEADGENELTVNTGMYSVTEVADSQYSTTYDNCTNLSIPLGGTQTCTVTNNDKSATLKLTKTVVNDNGGLLAASDFPVFLNGQTSSWGTHVVNAGSYTVAETTQPGYTPSAWGSDCVTTQNGTSVSLLPGETKECTITNDDQPAQLSGVKYEVNGDGSTVQTLSGWTICLDANNNDICDPGEATTATGADGSYSFTGLNVGTYNLAETNNLGGTVDGWTQIFSPQPVALGLGASSTKNDFGNFKNAEIKGYKFNDHNGNGQEDSGDEHLTGWTIQLKDAQGSVITTDVTDGNGYSFTDLGPGTYTICEVQQMSWVQTTPSGNGCAEVTVQTGGSHLVKFGNQAKGTLTVVKDVDDGFGNVDTDASGWTWDYSGSYADDTNQTAGSSNAVVVPAGSYTVGENQQTNYHFTSVSCTKNNQAIMVNQSESLDVSVGVGDAVVCTFVNTRDTANITVTKEVVNDNGGSAKVSDFDLYVNKDKVTSGVSGKYLTDVEYTVSEIANASGYEQTSLKCWVSGNPLVDIGESFTLNDGENVECKIVNDDIAPQLTVYKFVYNGVTNLTKTPSDFTMLVDGTDVSDESFPGSDSGTLVTLSAGGYKVDEGNHDEYSMDTSGDCEATIAVGEHKYCYVYNYAIEDPQIHVVKSGPDQAHEGDEVTYTFAVTNPGNVPFPAVDVQDDIAGTATYVSGDGNTNFYLDPGEEWTYTASYTIPEGQVEDVHNTVIACGSYGYYEDSLQRIAINEGGYKTVCDDDDHTLDVLHPGIKVVKDGPANGQPGTTATYTFTVTNTGDTPLAISKVMDDVAGLGVYVSGDENGNDLLDLGETWVYKASHVLQNVGSLTNTVEVCGYDSLELEVCGEDTHTTIVYVPQVLSVTPILEDTGNSLVLPLVLSSGLLGLAVVIMRQDTRRRRSFIGRIDPPFVSPTE